MIEMKITWSATREGKWANADGPSLLMNRLTIDDDDNDNDNDDDHNYGNDDHQDMTVTWRSLNE